MNPLWILGLLALSRKKKNNTSSSPPPADNPGNPGVDDYLDRM